MNALKVPYKSEPVFAIDSLILTAPQTEFCDFLSEIDDLVEFAPEILEAIDKDLDVHAKEKKRLRWADKEIKRDGLDDFDKLLIDSTSVKANSAWPTDAKMILGLLGRAHRLGQKLESFGLVNVNLSRMPTWLELLDRLELTINLTGGKANSSRRKRG